MAHVQHGDGTIAGALVSLGMALYSFFGSTLVVVQWTAAVLSIAVASVTLYSAFRKLK